MTTTQLPPQGPSAGSWPQEAAGPDWATATDPGGPGGGTGAHRVVRFARAVEEAFERLGEPAAWSMTGAEQAEALVVLHRLANRVAGLQARVLAAADTNKVGEEAGYTSTAAWLAHRSRQTRPACAGQVRLARALDCDFPATATALQQGRISAEQARVIVRAVTELTDDYDDLPPDTRANAEAHLLQAAVEFADPAALAVLGKRIFEVVCPEAADRAEGEKLQKEEAKARRRTAFGIRDNGDGTCRGWFTLPTLHGQLLKKALDTLTAPRRVGDGRLDPVTGRTIDHTTLLGQGFMELVECHLNPQRLPSRGGSPFTLVITMSLDALLTGIGVATLEGGVRISAAEARRLACAAGLVPAVLDGQSRPLDLGREKRLFEHHQRLALDLRYRGCATDGCDRPPGWVEYHHLRPWSQGGPTDQANGLPLCHHHHQMADHPETWDLHRLSNGAVRFTRRQ